MFISGMIEQKRRYKQYKARKEALPEKYRKALDAVERYVWNFASGRMDSLLPLMEDLADLFEQSAANGTSIRELVGDDPVEFAETLLRNYPEHMWIDKARRQLTHTIEGLESDEESR
jgi:DNA-binding ferritin-like protein (Dps family)